jgi:hypothetical protein
VKLERIRLHAHPSKKAIRDAWLLVATMSAGVGGLVRCMLSAMDSVTSQRNCPTFAVEKLRSELREIAVRCRGGQHHG